MPASQAGHANDGALTAAGGTKHHAELLKPFGLDARGLIFREGGLNVIAV